VQVVSDETAGPAGAALCTDARGAFEVSGLPPGSYRLIASPPADKPMYLSTDRLAAGPSAVVELEADEINPTWTSRFRAPAPSSGASRTSSVSPSRARQLTCCFAARRTPASRCRALSLQR